MNKKLVCRLMSVATLLSGAAFADCEPQMYVGGEAQATYLDFTNRKVTEKIYRKAWLGGGAFVGSRFNENLGVELGYTFVGRKIRTRVPYKMRTRLQNLYLDMMGYCPLDCATDFVGSVGIGHVKRNRKVWVLNLLEGKRSYHVTNVRVGLGVQYKITDNLGARLMLNYQPMRKNIESLASAKLGLFYQF